jgi:long-chain acyl-CoA synthetase
MYGKPLLYTYGATEFGGSGTVAAWTLETRAKHRLDKRGSVGRASPGVTLRVIDPESGRILPPGQEGILEVHKPDAPMAGSDGWIRTNDLAAIDADEFVFIKGRADDTIIRGGFKVQLGEVEAVLLQHPAVQNAAAIGLPDARLGHVPAAAVVLRDDYPSEVTEAELIAWARERLSPYKVPVKVKFVVAIPLTQLLKVSRPQLRELLSS